MQAKKKQKTTTWCRRIESILSIVSHDGMKKAQRIFNSNFIIRFSYKSR